MFKKHAFQVSVVKPKKDTTTIHDIESESVDIDPDRITRSIKDVVTHTAKAACVVIATYAVTTAAAQIAVKRTKSKDDQ